MIAPTIRGSSRVPQFLDHCRPPRLPAPRRSYLELQCEAASDERSKVTAGGRSSLAGFDSHDAPSAIFLNAGRSAVERGEPADRGPRAKQIEPWPQPSGQQKRTSAALCLALCSHKTAPCGLSSLARGANRGAGHPVPELDVGPRASRRGPLVERNADHRAFVVPPDARCA